MKAFYSHKPIWENDELFSSSQGKKLFTSFDNHTVPNSSFTGQGTLFNEPGISNLLGITNRINQIYYYDIPTYFSVIKARKKSFNEIANSFISRSSG